MPAGYGAGNDSLESRMSTTEWYWCLTHERAETGDQRDDPDNSLGPYPSADAARNWRTRVEERNEEWAEQDIEWSGEEPGDETEGSERRD